jgi:large subunit ribosomal protein L6
MSRIGKLSIQVPGGVTVTMVEHVIHVKGPKGELKKALPKTMKVDITEGEVNVDKPNETKESRSLHGLTRTLISNMVDGVSKGFEKRLEIVGVGYRAQAAKSKITLSLGYSHPIEHQSNDPNIEFKMDEELKNVIIVSGIDKESVGQEAAKIRSYRKPEPYKGKGIKYIGERIIRKAGKSGGK